jgi:transposase
MAQGVVTYNNQKVVQVVNSVQEAYAETKRLLDRLVALRTAAGGTYETIAALAGCTPTDTATGQKLFDDVDAALAGLTTAYNALSQLDNSAL